MIASLIYVGLQVREEVLYRTKSRAIRRIPLVDERGHLAGVVAVDEVIAQLHEELAGLVSAVRVEMRESSLHMLPSGSRRSSSRPGCSG